MQMINTDVWCKISTIHGPFRLYQNISDREDYCLLSYGPLNKLLSPALIRVQSSCLSSEVFGSIDCDCSEQLDLAFSQIAKFGSGLIIYLRQEGRGQGLSKKIQAMQLSDIYGYDTYDSYKELGIEQDIRDYKLAAMILLELGITSIRLMTNNPGKVEGLKVYGINITEIIPHICPIRPEIIPYMSAKKKKLGHNIIITNIR